MLAYIYTKNSKFIKFGFIREGDVLVFKLPVGKKYVYSAFTCSTYCTYQDGKYSISNIVKGVVFLFPDLDTKKKIGFHIYNDNAIEIPYDKFIDEVEEIWEERKPIDGFKFDMEPIVYLKKKVNE